MRILSVIASLDPAGGGVAMAARQIVRQFLSRDIEAEIVCVDEPSCVYPGDAGLVVHRLGPGRLGYAWSPRLIPWLKANRDRFDAVICHGLWLFPSYAVWRTLRGNAKKLKAEMLTAGAPAPLSGEATPQSPRKRDRQPNDFSVSGFQRSSVSAPVYFVFAHGMLDPWFQRLDVRPLKSIRNSVYWRLVEWRVLRDAAAVCFTCDEERRLARTAFRPYQARELVVPYGVEEPPPYRPEMRDAFRARCPGLGDRPYLLFLGRVHPKKGVDLLVKAYAEVVRGTGDGRRETEAGGQRPEDRGQRSEAGGQNRLPDLVIAGPGLDTPYGQELRKLAARINQEPRTKNEEPRVHFVGMLEGDAKWGVFYGCEAFVLPSHQENFGIAVVEALACGKPVLLSDKVNIWREIEADGAAFVEPDSQEGTTRLLQRWFATGAGTRSAMGIAGRSCFEKRFTIESAARALLEAIREKLKNGVAR